MNRLVKKIRMDLVLKPMMPIVGWYFRVSPRMITCRQFNDFIFDYTEGLLSENQAKLFERHMRVCPVCRHFLTTYTATYKAGKAVFPNNDMEVPSAVPKELLDAIRDAEDIQNE